ncbi:MAG: tetratricopeptide repeat protein, partial [Deltaproteobacteria bacterium]
MTEVPGALARGPVTPLRALAIVLAVVVGVGAPPAFAAQTLSPREIQRLLRVARDDLESARALLAQDNKRGAKERLDEAEAAYEKLLEANPLEKEAAVGLSSVLFLTRRYEDGIRLLEPFYQAHEDDHDIAHQLGMHMYRAGHQASAVPLLEQVAADPGRFDASWLLAVHFYHDAQWARGLPHAERYVAARPDDIRAYGVLGTYYLKTERYADAVNALDGYLQAFPDNVAARINRANALFRMGRLDRAAVEYEALVAKHPDRMRLVYNLAAVRIQQGRCEDALPLLERFIAREDKDGSARYFRADCLLRLGRLEAAQEAFEGAREGAENNPWIYHGLSRIALQAGRLDEAVAQARRAAEIAPAEVEILAWLGTVLRKSGNPSEALTWHDKALSLDAGQAALHVERGRDLWLLGRLDDALGAFTQAHTSDPELATATAGIAAVRTARGI